VATGGRARPPHDADFDKYASAGAYHWREVGGHWVHHHAYTAERYRRTLAAAGPLAGRRVLDYGCGDGALLGLIARRVGPGGAAVGFEPNDEARGLAGAMLRRHGLEARVVGTTGELESGDLDVAVCAEVIEHVHDPEGLLREVHRVLKPGGRAVVTTPVRLTETPEDANHVREWFPGEFRAFCEAGPLRVVSHEQVIPAASAEVYYWRPRFLLRAPVFRLLCNLLSIYGQLDALSWLRVRPRLFMTQVVVLEKAPAPAGGPPAAR
jgi:SAM-dependent methyltransferase